MDGEGLWGAGVLFQIALALLWLPMGWNTGFGALNSPLGIELENWGAGRSYRPAGCKPPIYRWKH